MKYKVKSNSCEGWYQPVVIDGDKIKEGAKWKTFQKAYDALIFFSNNSIFPSEVMEEEVAICEGCGRPM